jgi:hypothetical protein
MSAPVQPPGQDKTVNIFVNGRELPVQKEKLTYDAVVALAYPNPDYNANTYKVTYFRSAKQEEKGHEGTLTKGQSVEPKDGMVFTVVPAVRS